MPTILAADCRAEGEDHVVCDPERALRSRATPRIQTLAEDTFADKEKAHRWLRHPLAELLGEAPLTIAQTEAGAKAVEAILGKIAWGATA